jgi:outer membrane protein TolC
LGAIAQPGVLKRVGVFADDAGMRRAITRSGAALLLAAFAGAAGAQTRVPDAAQPMTLEQVVMVAQSQSRAAAQARNRFRSSLWQYRTARAAYLPTLSLQGNAVDLTRSASRISLPDGSETFVQQSYVSSGARVSIGKTVGSTGGEVYLESSLERLHELDREAPPTYLSRPISLGFRQPLFVYNPHSWSDRIDPLRLEEARREYAEELESISLSAIQNFFDVLSANDQLEFARLNVASTESLYTAAQQRARSGRAGEDDVLQTELALHNAQLDLQRSSLELRDRMYGLRSYLGLQEGDDVRPVIGFEVPEIEANVESSVKQARERRAASIGHDRRLLEARRDVEAARSEGARRVDLFASFGLSRLTDDISTIYLPGDEYERATLGFTIPILDWGRNRASVRLAESNAEVTELSVEQSRLDLEQEVRMKVARFNVQRERIRLAAKADSVAARRYAVAERRFLAGRGDASQLSMVLLEKDSARRAHVDAVRGYWVALFELRRATGYDPTTGMPIPVVEPSD